MKKYILSIWITLWLCYPIRFALGSEALSSVRSLVQEWVDLEKTASKESVDWSEEKKHLRDLIQATGKEVQSLEKEVLLLEQNSNQAVEKRKLLLSKQDALKENTKLLKNFLLKMEKEVIALKSQLPKPLLDKLSPFYQRIPTDPEVTSIGMAERMQTVVGILSVVQKFNNQVTLSDEIKELKSGQKGEVRTLYLGLGVAYYLATSGEDAGVGYARSGGWEWISKPELASAIHDAIRIADNVQQEARFVSLPAMTKK